MSESSKQPSVESPYGWSHLDDNQKNGKFYDFKLLCYFCYIRYNSDKSDSNLPKIYCCKTCEIQDLWLPNDERTDD